MAISRLSKGNPPSGVYLATREFLYSVLCAGYALLDLTGGKKGGGADGEPAGDGGE